MKTAKKNLSSEVVDTSNPKLLPTKKRPKILLFLAFLFIFVGYLLTAQNLTHFGVMKTSLTHELPRVRHIAMLTLTFSRLAVFFLLFSLLFFLCFGEEINWGQRILKFETPEAVRTINAQNEFNLHNSFGYLADHLFFVAMLVYGCMMPLLSLTHEFWHRLFDKLGLPIASAGLAIGFSSLCSSTIRSFFPSFLNGTIELRKSESFLSRSVFYSYCLKHEASSLCCLKLDNVSINLSFS